MPLIIAGLLYGFVGVFALNVVFDVVLLTGAFILAVVAAGDRSRFRSVSHPFARTTS